MNQRFLVTALVVSLVVNVFVVGAIAGAFVMRQRMIELRNRPQVGSVLRVSERLPEDVRARYIARIRAEGAANRALLSQSREARSDAVRALSAREYDPKAAADALARARQAENAMRASLETAVVEFAQDLGPEERRIIARSLRAPGGPPPGGRRGPPVRRGDGPPPMERGEKAP